MDGLREWFPVWECRRLRECCSAQVSARKSTNLGRHVYSVFRSRHGYLIGLARVAYRFCAFQMKVFSRCCESAKGCKIGAVPGVKEEIPGNSQEESREKDNLCSSADCGADSLRGRRGTSSAAGQLGS